MRKPILFTVILAALCLFAAAKTTQAAVLYGESAVGYNSQGRYVYGYGQTWTDYELAYYYDPEVFTVLLQYETGLDSGSNVGYSDPYWGYQIAAYYETFSWAYQPSTNYATASHHKVRPYYNNGYGYWFDPFNFFGFSEGNYGGYWGLWGNPYNPYNYIPVPVVRPFNTFVAINTPPDCGPGGSGFMAGGTPCPTPTPTPVPTPPQSCNLAVTLSSISAMPATGDLNGQTRPAMLGAPVALQAKALLNGSETTSGTWSWTASGGAEEDGSDESRIYVWRSEGTANVSATFTTSNGQCSARAALTVNVTVPSVVAFTGDVIPERLTRDVNTPCSLMTGIKDKFTLGCARVEPTLTQPGITFNATAALPQGTISDPTASRIKFTQIVNIYRRRVTAQRGTECGTFRTNQTDYESPSAWVVDSQDPYQRPGEIGAPGTIGVKEFADSNSTAMIKVVDSPGHPLSDLQNLSASIDDRFEMLVFYFVGDPTFPEDGTQQVIGKLAWRWGGEITYTPSTDSYSVSQVNPSPHRILGQSTRQVRQYNPNPYSPGSDPNFWKQCGSTGGGPTPTPTPTPNPTPNPTPGPTPFPTPPNGCSGNGAEFVSQSVPTTMDAGTAYDVSVTMKNTCGTTWVQGRHRLGSQNPHDNLNWNLGRVDLPSGVVVGPGATHTFNFTVVSPSTPGLWNFQWRMVEEGVEWFGEHSQNVVVNVVSSGCDPYAEQSCYYDGGTWNPLSCTCKLPPPCWKCEWQPVY